MKKLMALVLALILTVALAACSNTNGQSSLADSGNSSTDPNSTTDPAEIPPAAELSLTGEIGGEITVSCYDTMKYKAFLEDAARLFEEKYPGTKVHVETFSAMPEVKTAQQGDKTMVMMAEQDDPQGRADYISKVNTALMSGEGADILAMDILPIHKYADSGQLENLAAYMDADSNFNRADYLENVLDAIQYKGGTWFLPMNYTFDYYAYDTTLLPDASGFGTGSAFTVEQLIGMAESAYDGSSKLFNIYDYMKGPGGMWRILLEENYASFVDVENKTAHFDDGSFAALLESVKQYSEQGYIPKGVTGQSEPGAMMRQPGQEPTDRFFFKPKNVFNLLSQFTRKSGIRMNIMTTGGASGIEEDDEIAGIAASANGSVPFTYEQAYGMNANSKNKETAWAFLTFLLSEEMQLNTNLMPTALPLQNAAREKKAETELTGMMGQKGQQGQSLDEAQTQAIAEYNEAMEQLSKLINGYVFEDSVVNDMITAEVQYFFDGSKTASEVASVLQNKIGLYLSE